MKVLAATLALLLSSPAVAQECKSCSEADTCIQTYVKAASEAQRTTKVGIRDWQQNLDKRLPRNFPTGAWPHCNLPWFRKFVWSSIA
jgi:hypothetical protein